MQKSNKGNNDKGGKAQATTAAWRGGGVGDEGVLFLVVSDDWPALGLTKARQ